jgi:hypothetical protein
MQCCCPSSIARSTTVVIITWHTIPHAYMHMRTYGPRVNTADYPDCWHYLLLGRLALVVVYPLTTVRALRGKNTWPPGGRPLSWRPLRQRNMQTRNPTSGSPGCPARRRPFRPSPCGGRHERWVRGSQPPAELVNPNSHAISHIRPTVCAKGCNRAASIFPPEDVANHVRRPSLANPASDAIALLLRQMSQGNGNTSGIAASPLGPLYPPPSCCPCCAQQRSCLRTDPGNSKKRVRAVA